MCQNEWQMSNKDNANRSGESLEMRAHHNASRLEAMGELTKKGNRRWHHLLRDQNKTNVAERIITALVKTGKPEMVWDTSALDMCSARWWLDTRAKEDIQGAAGEQWLPTKDDNQEVQSHGNERRKVPRSSYQQCLMLLKKDSEEKFSHRKKASPSAKAGQKAQAMCRWKRVSKIPSTRQWFNFSPRVIWLITTPDDNKLDDFTSTLKADLFGKCLWGPTERIIKRRKIVINKRKRGHTFPNYRIPKLLAVANSF